MKMHILAAIFALCIGFGPLCGHASAFTKVDIAASPAGGAWYVGLGAYAKALTSFYPELDTTLFPGGGISNILRVAKGDSAVGITATALMKSAKDGTEPYRQPVDFRALGNINDLTRVYFVVPANSKITSIRQIVQEKMPVRINYGSKMGGNAELFVRWILEAYGATKKDIQSWGGKIYGLSNPEATAMMQEGQLDIDSFTGPGEPYRYLELLKTMELRFLPIEDAIIDKVSKENDMQRGTIPASFFGGSALKADVPTLTAPTALVVNTSLPDDLVYKMARALTEGRKDIALALPAWDTISPETVCTGMPAELHPGAAKYYKEIGCLK